MKKIYYKLILVLSIMMLCLIAKGSISYAASANISSNSKEVNVGESVNINVSVDAIAWNLKVNGSGISESIVGGNMDGDELSNKVTNKSYKLDTSKAGTYTVKLSGDITDANGTAADISKSVTVKVNEKPAEPVQKPEEEKPAQQQKPTTQEPEKPATQEKPTTQETQKPAELTFTSVNETVYVNQDTVNIRESYTTSSKVNGSLKKGDSVVRTGVSTQSRDGYTWSRISYNGKTAYVITTALTKNKVEAKEEEKEEEEKEEKSTNKLLKDLIVEGYELKPEFDPQTTKYSLELREKDEVLDIKATPESDKAKVQITGNEDYKIGNNIVKIVVTAEDGTTRFYTITVTKNNEESLVEGLKLDSLQISNATLEPEFNADESNYVVIVEDPSTITAEGILATVSDKNITITTSETTPDENGEKVITIMLESKDGEKTGIYQIVVKKPVKNESAPMVLTNGSDNTVYYILGAIIGTLLLLIIIIVVALRKMSNKNVDDINEDELSDDYDYNLKDAIDEANKEYDDMVEESNYKSQILNTDLGAVRRTKVMESFDEGNDGVSEDVAGKKKGKHF